MSKQLKADISLLVISMIWGAGMPVMSLALQHIGPYTFMLTRYSIATIILLPFVVKRLRKAEKESIKGGALIGLSMFLGSLLQTIALLYTTPSKAGFLTGLYSIFVPVITAVIYRKLPDLKTVFAVGISLFGLAVMTIEGSSGINIGDVLLVVSAVAYAFQILLVGKYAKSEHILETTFMQMLVVSLLSFIPSMAMEKFYVPINKTTVLSVLFIAVFSTVVAYMVQNKMQPYTDPTHAAIIFLSEPLFVAIFSIFVGDILTVRTLIGGVFIMLGMLVINIKTGKNEG
jgi:drug/metabolite transporter (DMT)-like permease